MYQNLTYKNRSPIKRFSHGRRLELIPKYLQNSALKKGAKLLDYGTGDGKIFKFLAPLQKIHGLQLAAYEPIGEQYQQLVELVEKDQLIVECHENLEQLGKYNYILCMEVLEHFSASDIIKHLEIFKRLLKPEGKLIISVPIESGFGGSLKNLVRLSIGQTHAGLNMKTFIKAFFGKPLFRGYDRYYNSHIGFNHKHLEYLMIDSGLVINETFYSPFPVISSIINSQKFYVCSIRKTD